ncbi:MAG: hypothetical protein U0174_22150 [Polyangiaceae bacterium]
MSNLRDDARRELASCSLSSTVQKVSRVVRRLGAEVQDDDEPAPLSSKNPLEALAFPSGKAPEPVASVPGELDRVRLIGELTSILHEPSMPEATRTAGLTLIGWLARRMPGEAAHALGCTEARTRVVVPAPAPKDEAPRSTKRSDRPRD